MKRYVLWILVLVDLFVRAPLNLLPHEPRPFWVRWPVGLWAVLWFRDKPRMWVEHADWLEGAEISDPKESLTRDTICRVLRDYADEAEPGILRKMWQEREDARRESERMFAGMAPRPLDLPLSPPRPTDPPEDPVLAAELALALWEQRWSSEADEQAVRELSAETGRGKEYEVLVLSEVLSLTEFHADWKEIERWVRRVQQIDAERARCHGQ